MYLPRLLNTNQPVKMDVKRLQYSASYLCFFNIVFFPSLLLKSSANANATLLGGI